MKRKRFAKKKGTSWAKISYVKIWKAKKKKFKKKDKKESESDKAERKERHREIEIARLKRAQALDMKNPSGIDNTFNRKSEDIYHRGRRSGGPGFSRQ